MKQHLAQWKASGSTQIAYCRQHQLPFHVFSYYKKKFSNDAAQPESGNSQLIPVSILPEPNAATSIQIQHHSGFSIAVDSATDLCALKPVLELLRSLS